MKLIIYIAGRPRLCEHVPDALIARTMQSISDLLPELEQQGRVILTLQQEPTHDHQGEHSETY